MSDIYTWTNEEKTALKLERGDQVLFIPTDEGNRDYQEFLKSGIKALPYVAPEVREPTTEEKLQAAGISIDELKGLLGL